MGLLANHEDEVGHGRAVDGPSGTGTEDDAYLRDHPGGLDVAPEDPAVAVKTDHALLYAGPGTVVQPDDRCPDRKGQVHDLVDLLGENFAEGAAKHGEVLGEDEHLSAVHGAPAGDHPVRVGPVRDAALVGPVPDQHVELVE